MFAQIILLFYFAGEIGKWNIWTRDLIGITVWLYEHHYPIYKCHSTKELWIRKLYNFKVHYCAVIMSAMASQITSLTIVYLSWLFRHRLKKTSKLRVTGLCEGNSPVTGPVTRKVFSFDDVIMFQWKNLPHQKIFLVSSCWHCRDIFVGHFEWRHLFNKGYWEKR